MQYAANPAFPNGSEHAGFYTLVFRLRNKTNKQRFLEHRLILMPTHFSQTTESRTALYYTQGGVVADTLADGGIGMTHFRISGHTGYWGVRSEPTGAVADRLQGALLPERLLQIGQEVVANVVSSAQALVGQGQRRGLPQPTSLIDGAAAIKDLQDTIFAYFAPAGIPELGTTQTQDLQLEFLNLTAPTSSQDRAGRVGWLIHPSRSLVDIEQDASRPFLYQYRFEFTGIAPLTEADVPDVFVQNLTTPRTGLQQTLRDLTQLVTDTTNGINTLVDAFDTMAMQQVFGPVNTFISGCNDLGDAVGNFISSGAAKIAYPLYAQRTFSHVLEAPRHSVTTLKEAAQQLGALLVAAADPRSLGRTLAGETLTGGSDDALTLSLNQEPPVTVRLGSHTSGASVASTIQSQVRALTPTYAANASAYRDFTATFADGQYTLSSGTKGSDAGHVQVLNAPDAALVPNDASRVLGLGLLNGGQEHAGSAAPNAALALLRRVEAACTHLQGFPDYFADQVDAQDAALAARLPAGTTRPQLRGDQYLHQTRLTPGDTLQGVGARVGVPWETLALVNRLTYPFVLEVPTTLTQGRVSSADFWSLVDGTRPWAVDAYQGQRVEIVAGPGAGQSRRILRNTATTLVLETAWAVMPNDTSDYAIRAAANPIQATGQVSHATARTVTDSGLALVAGSQRGLTLVLTSGAAAGDRRQITDNDATTLTLDRPWAAIPEAGALYLLLGPAPATLRQKLIGDTLGVPHPSAQARLPLRTRLQDVSAITGQQRSVEERLFGRDLLLEGGALVWDGGVGDVRTIAALPNLRQALVHYVNLPLGELEYAPGLGSYVAETLGLWATLPLQVELLSSVERTIRQDRRVARMVQAELLGAGGTAVIVFGAQAVNGSTVERIAIR
jgi:hypothetical protein